jgi:phosphate transport system protein
MSSHLSRDLNELHKTLLGMCTKVEELIHAGVHELFQHHNHIVSNLAFQDDEIDSMDVRIEEECLKLLALHQPVAIDLRRITTVMKISAELERVADLAVHISERAHSMRGLSKVVIPDQLSRMSEMAISMVHHAIDAYVDLDANLANSVCQQDDEVDRLNKEIIDYVILKMHKSPETIEAHMHLFSATRHIERVADHATNISEDIVYLVKGDIIRHRGRTNRLNLKKPAS